MARPKLKPVPFFSVLVRIDRELLDALNHRVYADGEHPHLGRTRYIRLACRAALDLPAIDPLTDPRPLNYPQPQPPRPLPSDRALPSEGGSPIDDVAIVSTPTTEPTTPELEDFNAEPETPPVDDFAIPLMVFTEDP